MQSGERKLSKQNSSIEKAKVVFFQKNIESAAIFVVIFSGPKLS